jgi:hypothetical protein
LTETLPVWESAEANFKERFMAFKARSEGVLVKHVNGETVVYDLDAHRAHRLDAIASRVWPQCDGTREARDIAAESVGSPEGPLEESIVEIALEELSAAGLLVGEPPRRTPDLSRRSLFQQAGLASGAVLVLPLVTSIVAPDASAASSQVPPPPFTPPPTPPPTPSPTPEPVCTDIAGSSFSPTCPPV